jgi:cbb3-type cytochrome oxidase subunit 3
MCVPWALLRAGRSAFDHAARRLKDVADNGEANQEKSQEKGKDDD